jgi:hypothetical protein
MKVPPKETARQAAIALERLKQHGRCTICGKKAKAVGVFMPNPEWARQFGIPDKAICYAICGRHGGLGSQRQMAEIEDHLERELSAESRHN